VSSSLNFESNVSNRALSSEILELGYIVLFEVNQDVIFEVIAIVYWTCLRWEANYLQAYLSEQIPFSSVARPVIVTFLNNFFHIRLDHEIPSSLKFSVFFSRHLEYLSSNFPCLKQSPVECFCEWEIKWIFNNGDTFKWESQWNYRWIKGQQEVRDFSAFTNVFPKNAIVQTLQPLTH